MLSPAMAVGRLSITYPCVYGIVYLVLLHKATLVLLPRPP